MPNDNPPSFSFADPGRLIAETFKSFRPSERVSVPDWTAQHRWLTNDGGGYTGRWNHDVAPYLIGPMAAISDKDVVLVGPGQCGKTTVGENWLAQSIHKDPADFLWFMQTDASLEAYVKSQIEQKLIDAHPILLDRRGLNRSDNSIHFKRFEGMTVEFLSAAPANMINKKAPRIVADEYDAYDQLKSDPKGLLDVRRQTFGAESRLLVCSHPDRAAGLAVSKWQRGIMALYAQSDRRTWWWQCPECGMFSSPNPSAHHYMPVNYVADAALEDIVDHAHLLCPHNGCIVTDGARRAMNLTGRWLAVGQAIDPETGEISGAPIEAEAAGFWIVGAMSPFLRFGIGGLARDRAKAERSFDATGEDEDLRTIVVKHWGFPYDPPRQVGSVDAEALADRAEAFELETVPNGVRFITGVADVQANRFEQLFVGWGVEGESWVLSHRVIRDFQKIPVDPATSPSDWDDLLDGMIDATFPLADGSGRVMGVRAVAVDSGGAPGVTVQAYKAWRRQRAKQRARKLGSISNRDLWSLLLLKGSDGRGARNLAVVYPDSARADRKAGARGEIPLGIFNANWFKDGLAGRLTRAAPGPGYVHFPQALRAKAPPHPFFEQLVAESRKPTGEWVKTTARNEALDLMVMSAVIAHLHTPSKFNWTNPPAWAAEWDRNSAVRAAAPAGTPEGPAAPPVAAGGGGLSLQARVAALREAARAAATAMRAGN